MMILSAACSCLKEDSRRPFGLLEHSSACARSATPDPLSLHTLQLEPSGAAISSALSFSPLGRVLSPLHLDPVRNRSQPRAVLLGSSSPLSRLKCLCGVLPPCEHLSAHLCLCRVRPPSSIDILSRRLRIGSGEVKCELNFFSSVPHSSRFAWCLGVLSSSCRARPLHHRRCILTLRASSAHRTLERRSTSVLLANPRCHFSVAFGPSSVSSPRRGRLPSCSLGHPARSIDISP